MSFSPQDHLHEILLIAMVLARVGTLVAVAPLFGTATVGWRVRALLALAITALVVPLQLNTAPPKADSLVSAAILVGGEAIVGLSLGLGVLVLFSAVQVAGRLISQLAGLQLAEVFDPGFETNTPLVSQLLFLVTMAVFLAIGGHRRVLEALLDTFVWLPAGDGQFSQSIVAAMTNVLAQSFVLGVRAAAPAMVALLLATLILALAGRTLPQLNVLALGFGVSALVTLAALGVSLGTAAWVFQEQLAPALGTVLDAVRPS